MFCQFNIGICGGKAMTDLLLIIFCTTVISDVTLAVPTEQDHFPQFFDNHHPVLSTSSFLQPPMQLQQVSLPVSGTANNFESVSDLQNTFNFQYPDFHVETINPNGNSDYLPQTVQTSNYEATSSTIQQGLTPPAPQSSYDNNVHHHSQHSRPNYFDHSHYDHSEKPILHKYISVHEIPQEAVQSPPNIIRIRGKPEKHVSIVFVKAPIASPHQHTEVILPEKPKHKTIVYLLLKKGRSGSNTVSITRPAPVQQPKPEVHYIRYNKGPDAGNYFKPQTYSSYLPH